MMAPSSLFLSIGVLALLASPAIAADNLRRLDFKLEGVSCARCIINTRDALRGVSGVKRCEISLKKPYGGVVIYETGKTSVQALCKKAETADPKVPLKVIGQKDKSIDKMPVAVFPLYTPLNPD